MCLVTHGMGSYGTDNDPSYWFHQGQANLRVLEVMEITNELESIVTQDRTYVPLSHPFVERLVGTQRRECLDRTLFWTTADLEAKLGEFQKYFDEHRTHAGLEGGLPDSGGPRSPKEHCRGLYETPIAE